MTLPALHGIIANSFMYFAALIAAWALLMLLRGQEAGGSFWGAVVVGEALAVIQALIGIIMVVQGLMPARMIHFLYGVVTVLTWPAVFAFTRGGTSRRDTLFWFLVSAFLVGIALRASATAAG